MMLFQLPLAVSPLPRSIGYQRPILLIGSCFTEHISARLRQAKFRIASNPHGILFNPLSVTHALEAYAANARYQEHDLFQLNELWNSWHHHTRFSHPSRSEALAGINQEVNDAHHVLKEASHLIVTLGSAFQYILQDGGMPVANNHRAPSGWFSKELLGVSDIISAVTRAIGLVRALNPNVQVILTVSPVRHIRDGVVANNRSKGRLIEAVHSLTETLEGVYYFPAYEMVIDVLRDHRYYDIDLVHPNYAATQYVWEQFAAACFDEPTRQLMDQVVELHRAAAHRPRFPETEAHASFLRRYLEKARGLAEAYSFLDLEAELKYFGG
jgi:hypothetical protein